MTTRTQAAFRHLLITLAAAVPAALLLWLWYPPLLFAVSGVSRLAVLIGAGLLVGPLLTLIVFRSGKRGMTFDLVFIGVVQCALLGFGLARAASARPVFVAFVVDRFVLVPSNRISDVDLAEGTEGRFRTRSWTGPTWVASVLPEDSSERMDLMQSALDGRDIEAFPRYYRHYADHAAGAGARARPLAEIDSPSPGTSARVARVRDGSSNAEDLGFLPLIGRSTEASAVVARSTGSVVAVLPVSPW